MSDDVLESPPSSLSAADAEALARALYGVEGRARPLTSERDQNFHLRTADGAEFVLKISNAAEDPAVADMQTLALAHVARADPDVPIPRVIPTTTGALAGSVGGPAGNQIVRLLTFLPGVMLHSAPPTSAQRRSLGAAHARLTLALRGFVHPAQDHVLLWDLKQAPSLRRLLPYVAQPARRTRAEAALDAFEARVVPVLAVLPTQVTHNDLNPHNVVVSPDDTDRVCGILDFGDMVATPRACDVAIAGAYQLAHGLDAFCDYVAAYHHVAPLQADEFEVLYDLVAMRMATSVLISEWRAGRYPENAEYILRNHPAAVLGLERLADAGRGVFDAAVRDACAREPRA